MDFDDSYIYVTLDFEVNLEDGHRLYLPEKYPTPETRAQGLALELWPDQFDLWVNGVSSGRPRSITWPQILNVVYHSIRQISEGFDPRTQTLDGVFWNTLREVSSANSAAQSVRRLQIAYENGLLPAGEWRFAYEENPFDDGYEWLVCGGYLPRKFSDIENIKRIPEGLRSELLEMLHDHAQKVRESQNNAQETI